MNEYSNFHNPMLSYYVFSLCTKVQELKMECGGQLASLSRFCCIAAITVGVTSV